jgi:hypothetical protein
VLSDCCIGRGTVTDVITPLSTIPIFAKTEEGRKIPLDVSPGETTRNVKQQIKRKEGLVDDSCRSIDIYLLDTYLCVCLYLNL